MEPGLHDDSMSMGFSVPRLSLLLDVLGVPSTKFPVDATTFTYYVLPPVVCCFIMAVLALTPQTRAIRVALWPAILLLALRGALSVDMSPGESEEKSLNMELKSIMVLIVTRTLDWSLQERPLVRHLRPANSVPSIFMDALDLVFNMRGHGWNWSHGLYVPRETRPTKGRAAFAFRTFVSTVVHVWICSILKRVVLAFAPIRPDSVPRGSTIFDESLPFLLRYSRASVISVIVAFLLYASLQTGYDLCSLPAILILGQDPVQWPPVFDAPWRATSLSEFWGRRWHQWFRRTFIFLGGQPLSLLFGREGQILGAFLASVAHHQMMLIALDGRAEVWWMLAGFGMMAPGVLAERAFRRWTGKKVGGVVGWVWTMAWLLLWGNLIVEGLARGGMFNGKTSFSLPERVVPRVEDWVIDFDNWLHVTV